MTGPVSVGAWDDEEAPPEDGAFDRLWRGFAAARIAIAGGMVALLVYVALVLHLDTAGNNALVIGVAYLAASIAFRLLARPPRGNIDRQWVFSVGIDLLAITAMQATQAGGLAFAPLYAVPVMMASVLGSRLLALGTAAAVTLLLLAAAWLRFLQTPAELASSLLQASLTGAAYFALAFLANQLSGRLAREEQRALQSQQAARAQALVNELVIETLGDGILVVDPHGRVRAANPTALGMLGRKDAAPGFHLAEEAAWEPLLSLTLSSLEESGGESRELVLRNGYEQRRVMVRTRLTGDAGRERGLCVVFMEDMREMESRLRNEKLAAMGRMSAAVAHEIRNPLAAIMQANSLLEEDLREPAQRKLSAMVAQNAQRVSQVVEEILSVSRVPAQGASVPIDLDAGVAAVCSDWARQTGNEQRLRLALGAGGLRVPFEPDHLRRVVVNLLDNASRYAGARPDSIQVATTHIGAQAALWVWSDGGPVDATVQRHLFEPFFSSESRSTGLGLYICRELCERHGAQISLRRGRSPVGEPREGNAFHILFRALGASTTDGTLPAATMAR